MGDAVGQGGGLYADGATLVLDNCWFSANTAQAGGGLFIKEGDITLTGSTRQNPSETSHATSRRSQFSHMTKPASLNSTSFLIPPRAGA